MRIYYFGELIEENGRKIKKQEKIQMALNFVDTEAESAEEPKKTGMESIGEILQELDLTLDSFRPMNLRRTQV